LFQITFGAANADSIAIYNNPNLATFDINTAIPTSVLTGDLSFQTLGFIAPNNENEVRFDNIVLGSTLVDVVPIPEPTSLALVASAGLLLLRRRNASIAK